MWNYIKLRSDNSPMAEILSQCSDKSNLRLVIYHLEENHVECATVSPDEVRSFDLGNVAHEIARDAENGAHAVLAYDVRTREVYLVDSTPELPVASAVLLCVVTELLNGCVQSRTTQCGMPQPRRVRVPSNECCVARRDANGRFTRREDVAEDEPWKNPPITDDANGVMTHRFRLGGR